MKHLAAEEYFPQELMGSKTELKRDYILEQVNANLLRIGCGCVTPRYLTVNLKGDDMSIMDF